jgi:hypothetical protein
MIVPVHIHRFNELFHVASGRFFVGSAICHVAHHVVQIIDVDHVLDPFVARVHVVRAAVGMKQLVPVARWICPWWSTWTIKNKNKNKKDG